MADQEGELNISFINSITTRDGTLTKDARTINGYAEKTDAGIAIVKRPGSYYTTTAANITGTAQGILGVAGNADTSGWYIVNDTVYNMGSGAAVAIPLPSPSTAHLPCDTLSNVPLNQSQSWIFNRIDLWSFTGATATKVTDVNCVNNRPYVPGFAFLDGVFYVMTNNGKILGSALNDATIWPGLDFVQAEYTFGGGSALIRHLNYIVAFYQYGTQVYYDANAAPNGQGIALNPVPNSAWTTGAVKGVNAVELSDVTYFFSQSIQHGRGVHTLQGLNLVKISTPFVDKILDRENLFALTPWANGIRIAGKEFYLLTLPNQGITLAYETSTQQWGLWSSVVGGVEQKFVGRFYGTAGTGQEDVMQDTSTGKPISFDESIYTDATGILPVTSYTPPLDAGNLQWKRFGYMYMIADTINTTVQVSFSDNDYASFSTPRNIDLSTVRKQLRNCGSSRRRSWKLYHADNTPLRIFGMKAMANNLSR